MERKLRTRRCLRYKVFKPRRSTTKNVNKNKRDAKIFKDSTSAIDAIIVSRRPLDPQVAEVRRSLEEFCKSGTHTLFWVKAHVCTPENERVNILAKEVAEKFRTEPEYVHMYMSQPTNLISRSINNLVYLLYCAFN
ncbi:unnamed protein product [Pieris macdunnoughi]|uniref:RNase H type-1 domain-containing protein n=1 Tax=Pieris macdunnoughi TaxID=345717 RepID=A0A821MD77_9NEOP|nr:unnamed protein product [Pieris macdunnoughi]